MHYIVKDSYNSVNGLYYRVMILYELAEVCFVDFCNFAAYQDMNCKFELTKH